jgi:hypothetical protein
MQEAATGVAPSDLEVWYAGHKANDPLDPEKLCSETATEHLVKC